MVGIRKGLAKQICLLPSMLAASLILAACQKDTVPNEDRVSDTAENIEAANDRIEPDTVSPKLNAEEKLEKALSRHRWTLIDATDATNESVTELIDIKNQVTLSFNQYQGQPTLSYSVGCNTISATYQLKGYTLTTEDEMSTKISCSNLDAAENLLNTLMLSKSELKLDQGESVILTQFTKESDTLVWSGRLTAQAKYNSKGETVFWAVDSKKIPCDASDSKQCLQVKPIVYDDQGIKVSEGKWRVFVGEIDGYQYDGKHRETLRLQRYQLEDSELPKNATADESYDYVLDAVIESTVVK